MNIDIPADWRQLSHTHYENFGVASLLLPASTRQAVRLIYAFARIADDIADEGDAPIAKRLEDLNELCSEIESIALGQSPSHALFKELAKFIEIHKLPLEPFFQLLNAFAADVEHRQPRNFSDLMGYCRNSANPVGRLLLALHGVHDTPLLQQSDAICSALQLLNFIQDLDDDLRQRQRIYLPKDEMDNFGISWEQLQRGENNENLQRLYQFQLERIGAMLKFGSPLANHLQGRFSIEIHAITTAAWRIWDKLRQNPNPFDRPEQSNWDRAAILMQTLIGIRFNDPRSESR